MRAASRRWQPARLLSFVLALAGAGAAGAGTHAATSAGAGAAAGAGTAAAGAGKAAGAGAPAAAPPSATFRGDGARTGVGSGRIATRPGVRWTFATGADLGYPGQPVLLGDRLFFGAGDDNVYAVDARSGAELWRFHTGGAVYASPLVVADTVVAGSYDGKVYGVDAATGVRRWTFATGDLVESSACATTTGGAARAVLGSYDHHVYALDPRTGALAWKQDVGDAVYGSPACAGGLVLVGAGDRLVALRDADGARAWEAKLPGDYVTLAPAVAAGKVVIAGQSGRVYAFALADGKALWNAAGAGRTRDAVAVDAAAPGGGSVYTCALSGGCAALSLADGTRRWAWRSFHGSAGAPVVAEGLVYVVANAGAAASAVYALDAATGLAQWDYRLDAASRTSPMLYSGVLYGGTEAGVVYALSPDAARVAAGGLSHTGAVSFRGGFTRTGSSDEGLPDAPRLLWTAHAGGAVAAPGAPVLAAGLAVASAADGAVWAFSAATGDEVWHYGTGARAAGPPTVADGVVYAGSDDGAVHALDLATGELRWRAPASGPVASAPCVVDGRVVATTTDGHVTAFAVRDGTRAWDRALGPRQPTAPACDAGRVFTATTDALGVAAKVHALDLATGEPAWTRALSDKVGVTTSLAVAGGGVIVAATTGTVYRLDRDTGSVTWTATARGELRDAPAVAAKVVLVCSAADDGGCTAFDLTTGVRRWEKAVGPASGAPVIAGGSGAGGAGAGGSVAVVPVAKGGGVSLAALRLSTGEALWSVSVPGRGSCTPTLSAGLLLVGNDAGAVYLVGRTAPAGFPAVASGAEGGATGAPSGYALFRGEGTRLGVFRGKVPSAPRVLWSAKAGDDIGYPGQPVVFDGRVFVGSGSGGVYAFDERSGKKLWHFDTRPASGAGGSGGPAGGGGGGDGSDAIGFGVYTSPTYWNGLVLAGSYDRSTYAVDARTGKVRWRFKTGGLLEASVCVESGAAMIASFDGRLYAVDVLSGRELWSYNARGALQTSPACAGGRVYAAGAGDGTPGQAFAVDAATGRELWVHPLDESPVLAVTLAGDALYVAGDGGTLRALAPDDGRELWSAPGPSPMREAVAIADRKLFACSSTGLCGAYRLPGGAKVWEKKIGAASRGAPFWAGGVVVATAVDAPPEAAPGKPAPRGGATEVVGLDATSGTELWRVRLDGTTRTSAALYNGHIYVGTETGALHALGDPPR